MKRFLFFFLLTVSFFIPAFSQDTVPILPAQGEAIRMLANAQGFSPSQLDDYLMQQFGNPLNGLTRNTAAEVIRLFQSENPPVPPNVHATPAVQQQHRAPVVDSSRIKKEEQHCLRIIMNCP